MGEKPTAPLALCPFWFCHCRLHIVPALSVHYGLWNFHIKKWKSLFLIVQQQSKISIPWETVTVQGSFAPLCTQTWPVILVFDLFSTNPLWYWGCRWSRFSWISELEKTDHFYDALYPHLWESVIMETGQANFMRKGFSAWRVQSCVSGRRNVWVIREEYEDSGCQKNVGKEEETCKGNKVASNINLVFLAAFLLHSDYVPS